MYEDIVASLEASPIVEKTGYSYFVHSLTNGIPSMDPKMLGDIADWMVSVLNKDIDVILAPEAMGIPYATLVSVKTGIPVSVVRKSSSGLPDEIRITQLTGYSKNTMFIVGLREGMKVAVIDDVISTGGTMDAILSAVRDAGAEIVDVVVAINKDAGADRIRNTLGVGAKTMFDVRIVDGKVSACLSEPAEE